ncbi:2-hydroxyacid dehydrogenase [Luteipulveratus mongoliensis]|uniref:2-hydroxyacid dehydrogenase n=2 Tax=Luteipulveratus mongoliensis TaxID=571913 RepID=A0A0K1JG09_9MICO|nr:2-hydroxyacid dehydrogenase [Luteipulveratus mongoliensis]
MHSPASGDVPNVLVAMSPRVLDDVLTASSRRRLAQVAHVLPIRPVRDLLAPDLAATLGESDVLLSGWGCPPITGEVLAAAPRLQAVVHAAGTVKGLVSPEVLASGLQVSTAAAANAVPVAEFAFASIVLARKRAFQLDGHYQQHALRDLEPVGDLGTHGITVGVVGASRIGRLVLQRLATLDATVLLFDPHVSAEEASRLGARRVELDELFGRSEVVTLHAPALPETHHLVNAARLALMPDRGVLINTARGSLVDHDALLPEVTSGRLDAVLDVTDPEPLPPTSPYYDLPNVVLTPHISGALGNERARLGEAAVAEIERLVAGLPMQHLVHLDDLSRIA